MAGKPPLPYVPYSENEPVFADRQGYRETEAAAFNDERAGRRRVTRPLCAALVLVLALLLAFAFLGCTFHLITLDLRRGQGDAPGILTTQPASDDPAFNEVMEEVLR